MDFDDLFTDEIPPDIAGNSILEKDSALALLLRLYANNTQNQKHFAHLRRSLQEYLPEIISRDALTDERERNPRQCISYLKREIRRTSATSAA